MTCNNGGKKFMQIKTNINGQDTIIIRIDRTAEEFKKKINIERIYKYDAIAEPIKNNIYPISKFKEDKFKKQAKKTFRK